MPDQPPEIPGGAQLCIFAVPRDTNAGVSIFGVNFVQMELTGGAPLPNRLKARSQR